MVKDILSQPHGGIFESICQQVMGVGSIKTEELLNKMSNTPQGRADLRRYLDMLKDLRIVQVVENSVSSGECPVIEKWDQDESTFSNYFKVELLSKIVQSKEPEIHYFAEFLRSLFNQTIIDNSKFDSYIEEELRKAKKNEGISIPEGEGLKGILDFVQQFLRYLKLIQKTDNTVIITIPASMFTLIIEMALSDINQKNAGIYSQILPHINERYLPVFTKFEGDELLRTIEFRFNDRRILDSFNFVNIPDGGKELIFRNTPYNQIQWGE